MEAKLCKEETEEPLGKFCRLRIGETLPDNDVHIDFLTGDSYSVVMGVDFTLSQRGYDKIMRGGVVTGVYRGIQFFIQDGWPPFQFLQMFIN